MLPTVHSTLMTLHAAGAAFRAAEQALYEAQTPEARAAAAVACDKADKALQAADRAFGEVLARRVEFVECR